MRGLAFLLLLAGPAFSQWRDLTRPGSLDGWESVGNGLWHVMKDGTVVGQRGPKAVHQAWLYTRQDFSQFDVSFDYWVREGGNSGISVRDTSRGRWAVGADWDAEKTPSHIGYEIQIHAEPKQRYPSGSIYLFAAAPDGVEITNEWNRMELSVRDSGMTVKLNGRVVAQHAGDPQRAKSGPLGLQLHDGRTVVFFRNLKIREVR
jgi:hypothetical protein